MNSDPHKYFLNSPIAHLTADTSPTKLCLDFSSGDTFDLEMKEIGRRRIHSREFSNSQFTLYFYFDSDFIASYETYACRRTAPIKSLDQSIFM